MSSSNTATFITVSDDVSALINDKANQLFFSLKGLDAASLNAKDTYDDYFIQHHLGQRLFFSIQNSAHIIYEAVCLSGKSIPDIQAIDYGAGLGTLFMLGGMLGFKKFDYNDFLPEWQATAKAVCRHAGIHIDDYITGGINEVIGFAASKNIQYDLVLSRNVIEHIYSLPEFFSCIFKHNPRAVVYATTTANFHNPVMKRYHIYIHKKAEKQSYRPQRIAEIKKMYPQLSGNQLQVIVGLTRGKGQQDFINAVHQFNAGKPVSLDKNLGTNVCDCVNGVWCEHLLTAKQYGDIIHNAGFNMQYSAGYWDTHYSSALKNSLARFLNQLIAVSNKKIKIKLAPFVNVVAYQ